MISTLRSLYAHQAWADAELLSAIHAHEAAENDEELRKLLNHILMVQRFFFVLLQGAPINPGELAKEPASFADLQAEFTCVHQQQSTFLAAMPEDVLTRRFEMPRMNLSPAGRDVLLQVIMHSQGHRAQAATLLRKLGGKPPILDYILWTASR